MTLGPWFKCYPSDWLGGMRDMDPVAQAFYVQIIFRMYENADAIYADDRTIGRWCNSNARPWRKVRETLLHEGKLVELSDGGLINPRALREMVDQSKSRDVPPFIRERLVKLWDMFGERIGKHSRIFPETSTETPLKTRPLKEARSQKLDSCVVSAHAREKPDVKFLIDGALEAAGLTERDLHGSPGLHSVADLVHLTQPASGEPCDWEMDVLPAIRQSASQLANRNQKLKTWRYVRDIAIQNRNDRIAGIAELPAAERAGSRSEAHRTHARRSVQASGNVAAASWLVDELGRQGGQIQGRRMGAGTAGTEDQAGDGFPFLAGGFADSRALAGPGGPDANRGMAARDELADGAAEHERAGTEGPAGIVCPQPFDLAG